MCCLQVKNVDMDPLPQCTDKFMMVMTSKNYNPKRNDTDPIRDLFVPLILEGDLAVSKAIQESDKIADMFISPIYSIPPEKRTKLLRQVNDSPIELLEGLYSFVIPKPMIDRKLGFYMYAMDSKIPKLNHFPNTMIASSKILDDDLRICYSSNSHDYIQVTMNYLKESGLYAEISSTKCFLELNCEPLDEKASEPIEEKKSSFLNQPSSKLKIEDKKELDSIGGDKDQWRLLSKKLTIDQEIINRLEREIDEKKQSLKLTGAEIVDLRRTIKMLQSENSMLKKKLGEEEEIQVQKMITNEIAKMSTDELKTKIVKLANAYKSERIKNEELEKGLQASRIEIANAFKLKDRYDQLVDAHEAKSKKLHDLQRETQKLSMYKDTIQKQEKVITKLEALLAKAAEAVKEKKEAKAKQPQLDMAMLKGEISKEIASAMKQFGNHGVPATDMHYDWEDEKARLENDLFQAESKIKSLEVELTKSSEDHAKEVSRLMMELNEKKAMLDSVSVDPQNVELSP